MYPILETQCDDADGSCNEWMNVDLWENTDAVHPYILDLFYFYFSGKIKIF